LQDYYKSGLKEVSMPFLSNLMRQQCTFHPRRLFIALLALIVAAAGPISAAAPQAAHEPAVPASTITPVTWTFAPVEGQSYAGIVAAFTDSDSVTVGNFTNVTISWGDGLTSTGIIVQSIDSHFFFVAGTHTFGEERPLLVAVSFHDVADNTNVNLSSSTPAVDDAPLCACSAVTPGAPTTFSGTGNSVTATLSSFKAAIGGIDNGGTPSPQLSGFRAINWDGVTLGGTDFGGNSIVIVPTKTVGIPVNRFQTRGVYFDRVYAVSGDGFQAVNPNVAGHFIAFSGANDFAPFNTHEVNLDFVAPSLITTTSAPAGARGFGGIFINVHNPDQTSIEYFAGPVSLGKFFVPIGPASNPAYSFFGALFSQANVSRVHVTLGSDTSFSFDGTTYSLRASDNIPVGANVVALDDIVYAEPQPAAPAALTISPTAGIPFTGTVGSFVDADPNANFRDFTATIDWGDGHSSPGRMSTNGSGGFNVSGSNVYNAGGNYRIIFTVLDFGGAKLVGSSAGKVPQTVFLPVIKR
jgi:hypothetical protein